MADLKLVPPARTSRGTARKGDAREHFVALARPTVRTIASKLNTAS